MSNIDKNTEALQALLAEAQNMPVLGDQIRTAEVVLTAAGWTERSANLYAQPVQIAGVTENTQVDLTPSAAQLLVFHQKDLCLVAENEDGNVTVYAIGQKPANDYTIQVTLTEVGE